MPRASQLVGVEKDLVLLAEAADGGDLGDSGHAFERVAQIPVLQAAQLLEIERAALVDERVLEHPADAGGVGAEHRRDARAARRPETSSRYSRTRERAQ